MSALARHRLSRQCMLGRQSPRSGSEMQLTDGGAITSVEISQIPIFDIDTHFAEPPDLWTSRAPAKFKGKVLQVKMNRTGEEAWYIEDRQVAMIGPSVIDSNMVKQLGTATVPTFAGMARAASFSQERLTYMDSIGCGNQIIYPN